MREVFDFRNPAFLTDGKGNSIPIRITRFNSSPFEVPNINAEILPSDIVLKKSIIKKVIFNDPATIVIWNDDTKTVVKCQPGDTYSKELGLAMCISKKFLGNKGNFNEEFKKWIPVEESINESVNKYADVSLSEMISALNEACDKTSCGNCIFRNETCDIDALTEEEIKRQYAMLMNEED